MQRAVIREVGLRDGLAETVEFSCGITAALRTGITRFDASIGGLGGCPYAPGATGNVNIEDVVFLLESEGYSTGIDIDRLLGLRCKVESWLPGERFSGAIARAGLPINAPTRQ